MKSGRVYRDFVEWNGMALGVVAAVISTVHQVNGYLLPLCEAEGGRDGVNSLRFSFQFSVGHSNSPEDGLKNDKLAALDPRRRRT